VKFFFGTFFEIARPIIVEIFPRFGVLSSLIRKTFFSFWPTILRW